MVAHADFDRTVGANIQRYRAAKGMSQAELAEQVGRWAGETIAQQTIQKIEKGTRSLRYEEAVWIALVLSVDIDDLRSGELESQLAAQNLRDEQQLRDMAEELQGFADRLAPLLVNVAIHQANWRGEGRTRELAEQLDENASAYNLNNNWGKDLNNAILRALSENPYLAGIKPEFSAPTYSEILKRVAANPPIMYPLDESDA